MAKTESKYPAPKQTWAHLPQELKHQIINTYLQSLLKDDRPLSEIRKGSCNSKNEIIPLRPLLVLTQVSHEVGEICQDLFERADSWLEEKAKAVRAEVQSIESLRIESAPPHPPFHLNIAPPRMPHTPPQPNNAPLQFNNTSASIPTNNLLPPQLNDALPQPKNASLQLNIASPQPSPWHGHRGYLADRESIKALKDHEKILKSSITHITTVRRLLIWRLNMGCNKHRQREVDRVKAMRPTAGSKKARAKVQKAEDNIWKVDNPLRPRSTLQRCEWRAEKRVEDVSRRLQIEDLSYDEEA